MVKNFIYTFYISSVRQMLSMKAKGQQYLVGLLVLSASHVLGDVLAWSLPEKYIFAVCLCREFYINVHLFRPYHIFFILPL